MLTQEEINTIREGLVTKEDLKVFATKDDLKGLINKTDLSRFEKKDDQKFKKVDQKFKKLDERFDVLEEKIETIDEKVDGVLKFASNIEEERDANDKRLSKIEAVLNV